MDAKVVISLATVYVFIYYFLGQYLLYRIRCIDSDYFTYSSDEENSVLQKKPSVLPIIFDDRMPKKQYPSELKALFFTVKVMLLISPFIFLVILFLL